MAQLDDIAAALKNADAAGDTEAAQQLADAYRAASSQAAASAPPAEAAEPPRTGLDILTSPPIDQPSLRGLGALTKGAAIGAASSVPGIFGDLESMGRTGLNAFGANVSPESLIPGTDRIGNFIAGPPSSDQDALGRMIGGFAGPTGEVEAAKAALAAAKTVPSVVSQTMKAARAARDSDFVIPPNLVGKQSIATDIAQAGGGKAKIAQSASAANQERVNAMAAKDLGLPPDTAITDATLNDVKSKAGQKYQAVANSVPKGVKLKFDQDFVDAIRGLDKSATPAGQEFPQLLSNDKISALQNGILNDVAPDGTVTAKSALSPAAGIDLVKELRSQANANFKAIGDPERHGLAIAQRDAANAVDDLIQRRLTQLGKPGVVEDYQAARQMLAKAYDVEAATNTENGNVSARGLARLLQNGRPMSGELQKAAEAASAFPKAFQNPASFGGAENWSALDYFGTLAAIPHHPSLAAGLMSRPLLRSHVLSPSFQDAMVGIPKTPSGMSIAPSLFTAGAIRAGSPSPTLGLNPPSSGIGLTATPQRRLVN